MLDEPPAKFAQIDALFKSYQVENNPGAAVMIIHNKQVIYQKGFGLANVEENIKVSANSNFRLASVSKQFTAMAVLQLIEQGRLSLDLTINEIFPEFPAHGETISIRDLLRHTSGLIDYESLVPEEQTEQVSDLDVLNMMMKQEAGYFPAGEKYQYSNSAYAMLAIIVEKISSQTFSDYLQQHIFNPAKMQSSLAYNKSRHTIENRAYGYSIGEFGDIQRTDQSVFSAVLGDGGIYSNLNDLYRWDQALYRYNLLNKQLMTETFRDQKNNSGEDINYGYGWRLENYRSLSVKYHTGISKGFRNVIYRIPSEQFTVVILTNRNSDAELSPLQMARKIVDASLFNEKI